ncbi:MAG: hypothetical protein PVG83_09875 [Acidimicrobiia bacterium]|jgi:hypothetical protein
MRRWLALLVGVAAIAVAGTALALTGPETIADEETATETTVADETSTTEAQEPAQEPVPAEEVEEVEMVWEEPDDYVPYEPGDHTPPEIEILHPEDGQVFESHEVVFEGTTQPGARVFFGDHEAEVGEDGGWRIVLELDEGEHLIEAKAVEESGNHATDSVKIMVDVPEPKVEEPKKEEPKKEEPKKEEPKEEEPKEEEPEEVEWEFSAHQSFGECSESPPYDVFYGTGKPGSLIVIEAEYARKTTEVNEHGEWEVKVIFEGAPVGESFKVWVVDKFGHERVFEFVHTD